ncbi:hypothetical protein [Actinotalea solisilvae]|uniref:hypothetical protein n=1 Tax=Actinotalea solisilvae TaxID=2072922 RepID=UPI0018F1C9B9|nr:hypothetical protein [Actinotalea solisilvae]
MTLDDHLTATLRTLDPAVREVDPASPRARADLEAILATSPSGPVSLPARRRPTARRLAFAGVSVAAATAAFVVLPPLTGGDAAFATWTAAPSGLSAQEQADAGEACRTQQREGAGSDHRAELDAAVTAIAERRGVWTTVVLAGEDGFAALCIADGSARLFADAMVGSVGTPDGYAPPGLRDVVATDLGSGTMAAGDLSLAAGVAGADVVGITYRSAEHGEVAATVDGGRFALWFPGDELRDASSGVDMVVTYRDGTTATARLSL